MSSPEERLNELCSGNEETRDCCSFEGQTYGFFKGRYWLFSNFTMEISSHGVLEDGSNVFFLKCNQVQGGFFEVAVCLQDLDSFPKLYNKFRTSRPPGSTIILDTGMKGGVHLYVGKLVAKYEAQEDDQKTCVLTASKPGFLCTGYDGLKVFVLGPDQILPATTGCDDEIISHLRLKWIGPKPQKNLQVGPSLDEQSILSLFDQLRAYHGMNFPSILMMMAYSKLATNLSTVSPKYNLPSCHLVGDMATGKSRAADHMRAMSPFALSPNGSKSVVKLDNPTETILNQMLCVPGPVLIFDPPPALKDSAINQILDHAYQGVMHRTQNNVMESLDVSTGPVFVHAHEKKSMRAFSPTSLSKAVVGLHQRTKMADHGEMSKIDQDIMKTFAKYSAMYRFMVLPLDEDDLDMDRNAFTQNFKSELQDKFDSQILDTNSRLIQNYGLYCASLKQLLNDMPLTKAYCSCVMKELFDFFVNVCIPENLKFMMVSIGSKQLHGYVPEAVMKTLWNILGEMEFREFFQYVSLGQRNKSISISKEIFKDPARQLQNAQTLLESKFATNRCFFLGQNSTEDWFKKPSVSQSLESSGTYGKFTRSTSYVIPYAETPDSLKAVVREKAREFIHIEEDEPLQSVASNLCAYFDALYANSTLAQASPVATSKVITEVMDIYHSLDVNSKIKFLDHVRSFSQSHSGLQNISDEQNDNVLASIDVAQASNDNIPPSDDDANPCSDVLPVNKAPPGCSDDGNTTTAVKENKANEAAPPPKRKRQCRGAKRRKKD